MADLSQATRDAVREGAKRSAAVVLPLVFEYLGTPSGLIDVGAGEGWWSMVALDLGVRYVTALDLEVPGAMTEAVEAGRQGTGRLADLVEAGTWDAEGDFDLPPHALDATYDLALCLEMAEHVSPAAGDHLVSELCRVADAVLWSAAIPGQGGDGHVNEQWVEYWDDRFRWHGWHFDDPFRDSLWRDARVCPWYVHGLLLARPTRGDELNPGPPRNLVHPVTWAHHRGVNPPGLV